MTSARRAAVALAAICIGLAAAVGGAQARTKKERKHHHHHHRHHGDGGKSSEGRDHLKRANAQAGDGDCEAAIEEYTKAYELLDDPVVLFNRGECYRRTGNSEKASDDYRAFLDKVPNAPNRAAVEAKILALEAPEPAAREAAKTPPPAREAAKATPPVREAAKATPPVREPAKAPAPPPAPPKVAEESPPPAPPPAPPPPAPTPETKAEPAITVRADRGEESSSSGGSRPWVWIALSVLAVGAAVGGYIMLRPREEPPPETALGNYRF